MCLAGWGAQSAYTQTSEVRTVEVDVPFEMMAPWFTPTGDLEDEVMLRGTLKVTTRTWASRPGHIDRFYLHANAADIKGASETTGQRFRLNGSFKFDLRDPEVTWNPDGSFDIPHQPWKLMLHKVDPEPARLTSDLYGSTGATATPPNIPAPITVPCQRILTPEGNLTPSVNCGSLKYTYFYTAMPSIYRVVVASGSNCVPGTTCVVPDGATIFNGYTGGYNPPLIGNMRIYLGNVPWGAGPQGAYSVKWRCKTGNQEVPIGTSSSGSGFFFGSCRPIYSSTLPINMWAETRFRFFDQIGFTGVYQEITAVVTEKVFTFRMDERPIDQPPVIHGITVRAASRATGRCPAGTECVLADGDILYNGQVGDYDPLLSMQMSASDPEGDPILVEWFCKSGDTFASITNQGSLNALCTPPYNYPNPVQIYAKVSDGNNVVWFLPPRQFYYLEFIH